MRRTMMWKEMAAVFSVVLVLAGLPLLLWYWRTGVLPDRYPPGTKVITLTAVADGGIWTQDEILGYNYWVGTPSRVKEIPLNQGDHVVLRLQSADLLHSFGIPILRLGPVYVHAGHTVELEFDADRAGVLTFLCWEVCSPEHPKLRGRFVVQANEEEEEAW